MAIRATRAPFGRLPDGREICATTLTNSGGASVTVIPQGAAIVAVRVPDRDGRLDDVVLGFDSIEPYLAPNCYFGVLVGRYANRIANASFALQGRRVTLDANSGAHHLHGGATGLSKLAWREEGVSERDGAVAFTCVSAAGAGGYPGRLDAAVRYRWTDECELEILVDARTDAVTVVNLVSHPYFNLARDATIEDHRLRIDAETFLPVDERLIPVGAPRPVAGGPFDFRETRPIGARIREADEQLSRATGYDHCFVLREGRGSGSVAAELEAPESGRRMKVYTSQPGLQFYSGNHMRPGATGHGGRLHARRSGLCLEAQHFPDSPNRPDFPSTVLRPGDAYRHRTVYAFDRE